MHVTLHITTGCNMNCAYCYSPPNNRLDMEQETANHTIEFIAQKYPVNTGIIFFGGEPLLKKDLIKETIRYAKEKEKNSSCYFHYKTTTNGLFLDKEFLDFAETVNMQVSMSIDGIEKAHNTFRKTREGVPTFSILQEKIDLLLKYQPYSKILMTVSPETLEYYAESVEYLLNRGFKYLIVSLNYSGNWTDEHINELSEQYKKIAKLYEKLIMKEQKFYFSPFEMKLATHIRQDNIECYYCHLAKRQISIAYNGDIYPCVQFVKDGVSNTAYKIGDIESGINVELQNEIYKESKLQFDLCKECYYNPRCNNKCSCLNWQLTGEINRISPVLCETERVLFPVIDKLGERLYKNGAAMFIQKHYNAVYPILSMLEDMHN